MRGCNEASALASLLKCQTSDEVLFDGLFLTFYAGRFCAIVWNASMTVKFFWNFSLKKSERLGLTAMRHCPPGSRSVDKCRNDFVRRPSKTTYPNQKLDVFSTGFVSSIVKLKRFS